MQSATAFIAAMKETWLSDSLENSVFVGSPLLDAFQKVTPIGEHGDVALVAVRTGLSGGYSAVPRSGSSELNEGTNVATAQAKYNYSHNWFDVIIESAVIDETAGNALAVATAVETEREGAVDGMKRQLQRGFFSDGTAKIAATRASGGATSVVPISTTDGFDALKRGHLYAGLKVDIGTEEDEDSVAAGREITAVSLDPADPTITISGEEVTTEATHFVSIANNRSGKTSNEVTGLLAAVSATLSYGQISPETVPTWAGFVDGTAQDASIDLLYDLEREIFQSSGEEPDWCLSSAKQVDVVQKQLQAQVRFGGSEPLKAGHRPGLATPNGVLIERHFDCPNRALFMLRKKDLGSIRSKEGPQWAKQYEGSGGMLTYQEGTTRLRGALVWRLNSALLRRNTHAAATNLN